jgi:hypothetical protein
VASVSDALEHRDAVITAGDCLTVDDAGSGAQARAGTSTIRGKRCVRSFPGRLNSLTRLSSFRAMTLIPSCLISCSQASPEGGREALVGRHGATEPAGRARFSPGRMRSTYPAARRYCSSRSGPYERRPPAMVKARAARRRRSHFGALEPGEAAPLLPWKVHKFRIPNLALEPQFECLRWNHADLIL